MKLNWGFGIALAYIVFAACMILFAIKASQQNYDLVTENYYEDAVKYQEKIDADKNASGSTSRLDVNFLADRNAIELYLDGELKNANGTISFYKPDNAKDDFTIEFSAVNNIRQIIPVKKMSHGYWKFTTNWKANGKNFMTEKRIFIK